MAFLQWLERRSTHADPLSLRAVRLAMLQVASAGLKHRVLWQALALIPLRDATAFVIWLASFTRSTIRWRDRDYYIRNGELVHYQRLSREASS